MVTLHLPVRARDFYPDIRTSGLRWRGQETGRVFSVPRLPSTLLLLRRPAPPESQP